MTIWVPGTWVSIMSLRLLSGFSTGSIPARASSGRLSSRIRPLDSAIFMLSVMAQAILLTAVRRVSGQRPAGGGGVAATLVRRPEAPQSLRGREAALEPRFGDAGRSRRNRIHGDELSL